jgi:hypothetical protein
MILTHCPHTEKNSHSAANNNGYGKRFSSTRCNMSIDIVLLRSGFFVKIDLIMPVGDCRTAMSHNR